MQFFCRGIHFKQEKGKNDETRETFSFHVHVPGESVMCCCYTIMMTLGFSPFARQKVGVFAALSWNRGGVAGRLQLLVALHPDDGRLLHLVHVDDVLL